MELRNKELSKEKGITQKELADKLKVSEVTLSRATNGNTSLQLLEKIAHALSVPMSELFEQPKKGALNITCPHCGKEITLKVEE